MSNFGEIIQVMERGLKIPPKLLEPIGVLDGSVCWGMWVQRQKRKGGRQRGTERGPKHLVISPILPDYWCKAFNLQAILAEQPGALASICGLISEANVNIAVVDAAVSGYTHSVMNALCIASNVKFEHPGADATDDARMESFEKIGLSLLGEMVGLVAKIRTSDLDLRNQLPDNDGASSGRKPFLHCAAVENGFKPWYIPYEKILTYGTSELTERLRTDLQRFHRSLETSASQAQAKQQEVSEEALWAQKSGSDGWPRRFIRSIWREQRAQAVSVRALVRLAYCFIWASNPATRIKFRYSSSRGVLEIADDDSRATFESETRKWGVDNSPTIALASFNRHDRFMRVRFHSRHYARSRLSSVDVDYLAQRNSASPGELSSKGLLANITRTLMAENFNVLYVSTRVNELSERIECGSIKFVMPNQRAGTALEEMESKLAKLLKPCCSADSGIEITRIKVTRPAYRNLFVSLPILAVRRQDIEDAIRAACELEGFSPKYVRDPITALSDSARHTISECDAFLQLVVLRADEVGDALNNSHYHPRFGWLHFEWGLGMMLGVPCRRLIDSTVPASVLSKGVTPTNRDDAHPRFTTQGDLSDLTREVSKFLAQVPTDSINKKSFRR